MYPTLIYADSMCYLYICIYIYMYMYMYTGVWMHGYGGEPQKVLPIRIHTPKVLELRPAADDSHGFP